jgi:hypothetical protein
VRSAVALPEPETSSQAETLAPARESSVATAPELPSGGSAAPVTQSYRRRAQERADRLGAKVTAALSGPSLWHEPPKSLEQARTSHHAAAGHWEAQLVQGLRLSWGYGVHLPAKGAGHLVDWLTESPVTTIAAIAIYIACHYWLLHWLPWF